MLHIYWNPSKWFLEILISFLSLSGVIFYDIGWGHSTHYPSHGMCVFWPFTLSNSFRHMFSAALFCSYISIYVSMFMDWHKLHMSLAVICLPTVVQPGGDLQMIYFSYSREVFFFSVMTVESNFVFRYHDQSEESRIMDLYTIQQTGISCCQFQSRVMKRFMWQSQSLRLCQIVSDVTMVI